jgi:hypothetical protein
VLLGQMVLKVVTQVQPPELLAKVVMVVQLVLLSKTMELLGLTLVVALTMVHTPKTYKYLKKDKWRSQKLLQLV